MSGTTAVTKIEITARDQTRGAFESVRANALGLGNDVTRLAASFGFLSSALGVGVLAETVRKYAEMAALLDDLADSTGSSVESLSALANTARISGVDFEKFSTMTNRLAVGIAGVGEEGGKASRALELLGVKSKDPAAAMVELATSLDRYADGAEKAALLTAIFGKTGAQYAGFLKDIARDGLAAATVTAELAAQAEELGKQWERTKLSAEQLVGVIASSLLPALNGAIEDLKKGSQEAGGFWAAFVNLGLTNPFKDITTRQRELRDEIEKTNAKFYQLAQDGAGEGTLGVVEDRIKRLTDELAQLNREQLRSLQMLTGPSTFDARDLRLQQRPAAPGLGDADKEIEKLEKAYASLERQMLEQVATAANLGQVERFQIKLTAEEYAKLSGVQRARLLGIAATIDALNKLEATTKEAVKADQEGFAWMVKLREEYEKTARDALQELIAAEEKMLDLDRQLQDAATQSLGAYAEENDRLTLQIELFGKSNAERERAMILFDAEIEKKKLIAAGDIRGLEILEQLIAKRLELAGNLAHLEAQKAQTDEMVRMWQQVDRAAEDAFTNILQGGKNAFDRLKDALKQGLMALLYQLTVRPFIVNIAAAISGNAGMAGALGGGSGGLGGAGNILSLGSNLLGLGSGTSLLGAAGISGLFSGAGGVFGAGAIGNAFALSGAGQALGLSAVGLDMAGGVALTTLGATLGAAIPIIGAVLAIAALAGAFDKDPSQVMGRFGIQAGTSGFEDNAYTGSRYGNLGFLDNGTQYFGGAAAQTFNQIIAGTLDAIGSRLDDTQNASLASRLQGTDFGSFEGEYTTEDFIRKYGAEIMGKVISAGFAELDPLLQRQFDLFKGTADEMANFANVLLTVHDLTENIPTGLRETLIAALDGTQEISDQVIAVASAYSILQDVMNRDPLEDALDGIAQATESAWMGLRRTADAFGELIEAYDGSTEASKEIAQATAAYYQQLVQVIAGIRQLGQSIDAMFGGTIEELTLQTLDDQGRKQYYQDQIASLYSQLGVAVDPADVDRITRQINEYMRAAFGLLTPDEQRDLLGQYVDFARQVNELAQERLVVAEAQAQRQADQLFATLRQVMTEAANEFKQAASDQKSAAADQKSAAALQVRAAQTPITVIVPTAAVNG